MRMLDHGPLHSTDTVLATLTPNPVIAVSDSPSAEASRGSRSGAPIFSVQPLGAPSPSRTGWSVLARSKAMKKLGS